MPPMQETCCQSFRTVSTAATMPTFPQARRKRTPTYSTSFCTEMGVQFDVVDGRLPQIAPRPFPNSLPGPAMKVRSAWPPPRNNPCGRREVVQNS